MLLALVPLVLAGAVVDDAGGGGAAAAGAAAAAAAAAAAGSGAEISGAAKLSERRAIRNTLKPCWASLLKHEVWHGGQGGL